MSEITATQLFYQARYNFPSRVHRGICSMCGGYLYGGSLVKKVIKPTFTNHDLLRDSQYICEPCIWFLDNANEDMQKWLDLEKPRAARMYSHILRNGKWYLLNKANRLQMAELFYPTMPEIAVIADSGQKHLVFRARINPPGQSTGWVQFEEHSFRMDVDDFWQIYEMADALYQSGFTKASIHSGQYTFYPDSDIVLQRRIEPQLAAWRGSITFDLVIWMLVRQERSHDDD